MKKFTSISPLFRRRKDLKNDLYRLLLAVAAFSACLLAALMLIGPAKAGEATVTWVAPTTRCNGTALTNLANYTLVYGQQKQTLPLAPLTKTITGLTPGVWWFSLAANTPVDSSQFVTVEKTVTSFVTTDTVVYTFFRAEGNITVIPTSHTVPLGVACDATQSVNGKYRVDLEAVTWNGTRMTAALADCG